MGGGQNHALKVSVDASSRDIEFLKARFFADFNQETNDILTLYSYWQSNFSNNLHGTSGTGAALINGNAQNGNNKSNNVTSIGNRSRLVN